MAPTRIRIAKPSEMDTVRTLFREYADELGVDLCFQGFEEELQSLPGKYAEPFGRILFADRDGEIVGIVAMRPVMELDVEMKRLFVRPNARGTGVGRLLVEHLIEEARMISHRSMVLDTIPRLEPAIQLYRSLGFEDTEPYNDHPDSDVVYLRLEL